MKPTIALCLPVHNDLRMLRVTLPYEMKWADQVCILDMASTDGTQEYLSCMLRTGDKYMRRPTNTCPELGFAEARNAVHALASTDWIWIGQANGMLTWGADIHGTLARAKADVLNVETHNIVRQPGMEPETLEQCVAYANYEVKVETHRRIIRRGSGVDLKGYIHEEVYRGDLNEAKLAEHTKLMSFHFQDWHNADIRSMRYSWMILNAMEHHELQAYTNPWWYRTHYWTNEEFIRKQAARYLEYVAATGDK